MKKSLTFPFWLTNYKAYNQSIAKQSSVLTQAHKEALKDKNICVGVSPNTLDLEHIADEYKNEKILVFAQHVSSFDAGAHTGFVIADHAAQIGADGTILNHSEHRLDFEELEKTHKEAKEAGLITIICVATPDEVTKAKELKPDAIAYEPPELIGSSDVSVSSESPELITKSVNLAGNIPLLVGAGIHTNEDITIAMELGAKGFLVASGVVKNKDPRAMLESSFSAME